MSVQLNTQQESEGIYTKKYLHDSNNKVVGSIMSDSLTELHPVNKISKKDARVVKLENTLKHQTKNKKVIPLNVEKKDREGKGKKVSAASVATVAVASGTAAAVSGVGAWALEQAIGFAIYLSYAPANPLSQYLMAQMAASMAASIVSATVLATITNIALGVLVGISIIFTAVAVYNLFIAKTTEDKISILSVIGKTVSAAFHLVF